MDALDGINRICHLNDLCREIKRLGDDKERALDIQADAKIALLSDPKNVQAKTNVINAKRVIDKLGAAISTRKEQAKILQTVINTEARLSR